MNLQNIHILENEKNELMKRLYLTLISIFFSGCELYMDKGEDVLYIENNSTYTISVYPAKLGFDFLYPDTLITMKYKPNTLEKLKTSRFGTGDWQEDFKSFPKDTLSIFIFSTDTLNKYSWEEVRRDYKILKRYDLSYEDCKLLKFRVPYPPTPTMSRMKMYPKYGR